MNSVLNLFLAAILVLASFRVSAGSLKLEFARVSAGGGISSAGNLSLDASIGQIEGGGQSAGGSFILNTGFLAATLNPSTNAAPRVFLASSTLNVFHSGNLQRFSSFAAFSAGPDTESDQALLGYGLSNDNPALFVSQPALDISGTLTFTPTLTASGIAHVIVVVQDDGGGSNGGVDKSTNFFNITLTPGGPPNSSPIAIADFYQTDQDVPLIVSNLNGILSNDTDMENDSLSPIIVSRPAHGSLSVNADGSFQYLPNTNFFGQDSFSYRANDGSASSSVAAVVTIDVLGRPTQSLPGNQVLFAFGPLAFSFTNIPANLISVTNRDSRFSSNQVTLTVTNGSLSVTVTNGLEFKTPFANVSELIVTGPTTNVNAALASLTYQPGPGFVGNDSLIVLTSDEGGRTNQDQSVIRVFFGISVLAGMPILPALSLPGKVLTNATLVFSDPLYIQALSFDSARHAATLLTSNLQNGNTNRTIVQMLAAYDDGSTLFIDLPVTFYHPLLTSVQDADLTNYVATFTAPIYNPITRLFEQKVTVSNATPYDFQAFRISATNLPETVLLQNATLTQGGRRFIEYNSKLPSGSRVTLTLQYFSADLKPFSLGLYLQLLSAPGTISTPLEFDEAPRAIIVADTPIIGKKTYIVFPTVDGCTYYVQYRDVIDSPWTTSPVFVSGNGDVAFWLDDGAPATVSRLGFSRFYQVIRTR